MKSLQSASSSNYSAMIDVVIVSQVLAGKQRGHLHGRVESYRVLAQVQAPTHKNKVRHHTCWSKLVRCWGNKLQKLKGCKTSCGS